ncbi:hypothetical protein T4D_13188 [Trichinella pseudospiralis]|uniref:Uncharacterized protein n=1 Tax=Trichinella pseudospiralis TaxID=6337 RepID=A0A0V1G084_TRIPS|nr:hypothetical protein T4D_13188 [Trichinella pseudospiralis]
MLKKNFTLFELAECSFYSQMLLIVREMHRNLKYDSTRQLLKISQPPFYINLSSNRQKICPDIIWEVLKAIELHVELCLQIHAKTVYY